MRPLFPALLALMFMALPAPCETLPDSCFIIEEAWHSDTSLTQHAIGYADRTWSYSWTQEWANGDTPHLLGFSIPVDLGGSDTSFGDVSISYRYQTSLRSITTGPRLSFILPIEQIQDEPEALRFGVEAALPFSLAHSERRASHWNVRIGWFDLREGNEQEIAVGAAILGATGGRSVAMLEAELRHLRTFSHLVGEEQATELTINPGVRHAFESLAEHGIVPGISLPITFTADDHSVSLVFHAMFEHSFSRGRD